MSALVRGSQCLQSTRNTSLDPLDDARSHVTVTRYILHYSVTLVLRLARLSIPGRLAEVSLGVNIKRPIVPWQQVPAGILSLIAGTKLSTGTCTPDFLDTLTVAPLHFVRFWGITS